MEFIFFGEVISMIIKTETLIITISDFLWHEDGYIFRELGIPNDE